MKEIFDKEKCSKFLNDDEPVIVMDRKEFINNYIRKDKIRDKIEKYKKLEEKSLTRETYFIFKNIIYVLERLLEA